MTTESKEDFNEGIEKEMLDFIQKNYGMEVFTPGLERTLGIYLPYLQAFKKERTKITIIAGTNGKGQTAHSLTYLLKTTNRQTALWTSPHILSLRERFNFNGVDISYELLKKEIYASHLYLTSEHKGIRVSFYEFLFLVFLRLSLKFEPDHLILEVGLGGRLDAVNHFDADISCITSISRDHQSILGNRFDLILSEKIAVARKNRLLITQFSSEYLNELTAKYCEKNEVIWRPMIKGKKENYFLENEAMAQALYRELEPEQAHSKNIVFPSFKGRREEMTFKGNTLIFIGAHNIDGIRRMSELFKQTNGMLLPDKVLMSFSKRPLNEIEIMLKSLWDIFGSSSLLCLTSFNHPKALEEHALLEAKEKNNKFNKGMLDFVTDWKTALNESKRQRILVCGSYYFIGEVQRFLFSHS
jgi:dihydrofolate synthase/folylpolyglutamate synthase